MSNATKIKAAFGAAVVILLGTGIAALFQTFVREGTASWISHTWEVIDRLDELALQSKDAEEAARRLALEFATPELTRCREDLARVRQLSTDLQRLTVDNPVQRNNNALLRALAGDQAMALEKGLTSGSTTEMKRALGNYDRSAVGTRFAAVVQRMQAEERRLLTERTDNQASVAVRTRKLFAAAAVLSLLLIILAAWRASIDMMKRGEAEQALTLREEQYRQVVETAGDIIYRTDELGRFTFCNQTSLAMLHLTEREVIGRSYLTLIREDKRKEAERFYLRQFARRRKNSYYEYPVIDGRGRERWLGQNVQLLIEGDKIIGFQAIAREITERKRAEFDLEKSRAFIERIAATTPGILYVYDLEQRRNLYSNREVVSVLGYNPEQIQDYGDISAMHVHPDDLPALRAHHDALRNARDGEVRRIQYRARHAQGHWVWLASRDTPFERNTGGVVSQIVGIAQDITSRKAAEEKLAYQANFDALTGLANRHHFWTRLQGLLRHASIEHSTASLCILDLDLFKEINDRFGHSAGDEVLEALGDIVRSELRSSDVAGRLGGDEFAFVLPAADQDEAARLAERIRARLSTMAFGMTDGTAPFSTTATFGVAEWHPAMEAKELMEAADRALYRAKSSGRNRVCVDI